MFRSIRVQLIFVLVVFALAACSPTTIAYSSGTKPTAVVETVEAVKAATAIPTAELPQLKVHDVQIQIGVGSPIPVDAFISAELPDTCAQLAELQMVQRDFIFDITIHTTRVIRAECRLETLPFRMYVPLNMVNQPEGTYIVKVNGASTTFTWPSKPTVTPDPLAQVQTYQNALGFEVDYPQGWIVDEGGDTDILWSEKLAGPGHDGVPANVVKIDIVTEPNTTLTLAELVARQKQIIADSNGKVLLEEAITLHSGLPAVRMGVSGFADSVAVLAVVDGHPVMLVGYGDLARFDQIANTLRPVQP